MTLCLALPAYAETQSGQGGTVLEEVVVTAQRREQALQDVPASISAFGGEQLEAARVETVADLVTRVPNFRYQQFNLADTHLFIRGIGSNIDSAAADRSVATFIDDVYIGRAASAATDIFDLERLEVMRGPQGTLYGKNVVGGALNFVSRAPSFSPYARAMVGLGNYDLIEAAAVVNGPLSDKIAGSASLSFRRHDGYSVNLTTGNKLDGLDGAYNARGSLLYNGDVVRLRVTADYAQVNATGQGKYPLYSGTVLTPTAVRDSWRTTNTPRANHLGPDGYQDVTTYGVALNTQWDALGGKFTSITAVRGSTAAVMNSYFPSGIPRRPDGYPQLPQGSDNINTVDEEANQVSQELRYLWETDRFTFLGGVFAIREAVDRTERSTAYLPNLTSSYNQDRVEGATTSYAVFTDLTYRPIERLELSVGVRWTRDSRDFDLLHTGVLPRYGVFPTNPYSAELERNWEAVTPKFSVGYDLTEDVRVYGLVSRGYKSGGFNGQPTDLAGVQPFDQEYVWNYEVGTRGLVADGRVRFEVSAFQMDYTDLQVQTTVPIPNTGTFGTTITNAAAAQIRGVEASVQAILFEGFQLAANLGYLDAEITASEADAIAVGNKLPNSPTWNYGVNASYKRSVRDDLDLRLDVSYGQTDESLQTVENVRTGLKPAFEVWNAAATFLHHDGIELSFWGKNLKDELYVSYINASTLGGMAAYAPPRTYGVTLTYSW